MKERSLPMEPERTMQEQQLFVISKVCEYHHEKLAATGNLFLGFALSFEVLGTQNIGCVRIEGNKKAFAEYFIITVSVRHKESDKALTHYLSGRRTKEETLAWLKSEQAVQEIFENTKELSDAVDERA